MRRASYEEAGVGELVVAAPIGRAKRWVGQSGELYRLAIDDEPIGDRLLTLGTDGLGGFVDGAVDEGGPWLVRRLAGRTLKDVLRERKEPFPLGEASPIVVGLARALAMAERERLFPGPVAPDGIRIEETKVVLVATPLVAELLGFKGQHPLPSAAASWTPPEQADGAPWDASANRYVLGLVVYRLLSGELPFAGGGLRAALEAGPRDAPPFADEIARALPPGLMALTLRLLAAQATERPASAAAVLDELGRLLDVEVGFRRTPPPLPANAGASHLLQALDQRRDGSASNRSGARDGASNQGALPDRTPVRSAPDKRARGGTALRFWPIPVGIGVAAAALTMLAPAPAKTEVPTVAHRDPLTAAHTTASDCASCHPRQANEWRRSVMAHSVRSPLFNGLESLIEEQVGRDFECPNGAGILRKVDVTRACLDRGSRRPITGSGGEHWCVNCHSPIEKLESPLPTWDGKGSDAVSRRPVKDLLGTRGLEGISCTFCHSVSGPVGKKGSPGYVGNASWTSFVTGQEFLSRPEDLRGQLGIANSGYKLEPRELLGDFDSNDLPAGGVHARPDDAARKYLGQSEFCGSCHDVRLFGTDTLGAQKGEHFKRLRNAYSEWASWARDMQRLGKPVATCQACHMSAFPGTCEPGDPALEDGAPDPSCPSGTHFVSRAPGSYPEGFAATSSPSKGNVVTHYFSGVDVPLSPEFPESIVDEPTVDGHGIPLSSRSRRDLLLRHTFKFQVGDLDRAGATLKVPLVIENVGAGHRVPAGFSQEREIWVHLKVKDADGRTVYEVGKVDRADEDLRDKIFERVNVNPDVIDRQGRPEGLFGADLRDGPDVAQWSPPPGLGGTTFRGRGLINFQNGFFRCVKCIGTVAADGSCQANPGQERHRADRFEDGLYDQDTGECRSNLSGLNALFETYFPVGALDASRGQPKGPDAILDTRSMPPNVPIRYTYELPIGGRKMPLKVEARLLFRAFPPFLIKAFAGYEREMARLGKRPSGPLVNESMLKRLEVVELARVEKEIAR